jgi:hypothetical protein
MMERRALLLTFLMIIGCMVGNMGDLAIADDIESNSALNGEDSEIPEDFDASNQDMAPEDTSVLIKDTNARHDLQQSSVGAHHSDFADEANLKHDLQQANAEANHSDYANDANFKHDSQQTAQEGASHSDFINNSNAKHDAQQAAHFQTQ